MRKIFTAFAFAGAALAALAGPAQAATPAEFYKGRTVSIIIGYAPGGGYDLYGRLLAQHMGKYIPGKPAVIPQNMPGAGSLKAANYIYSVAPKDGTVIGTFGRELVISPLLNQAKFDVKQFTWLGSITKDTSVCVTWYQSPIKTWNDVMTKQATFGGDGVGSDPDNFALLYKNVFGAKIKLASGFPGTSDITLAMQRREVDGLCGLSWSTATSHYGSWITDKKINILIQAGAAKHPDLPNVPLASDLAKTTEQKQILDFIVATQTIARPYVAPPGIPADRKAALLAAFNATMKDPAFLAAAKKIQLDVNPLNAAEAEKLIAQLYLTPKDVVAKAAKAISTR